MTIEQINSQQIADKIYLIRGTKVMLDKDLAELYGVKAIRLDIPESLTTSFQNSKQLIP